MTGITSDRRNARVTISFFRLVRRLISHYYLINLKYLLLNLRDRRKSLVLVTPLKVIISDSEHVTVRRLIDSETCDVTDDAS